ncbi:hypothetical protein FRC02_001143 [Tulasnella sp. 418]|nr:hypothetical protein FRC02_001143 [Tulasnella sp. 418]
MAPSDEVVRSRLLGALYGLCVGDAMGCPYEFQRRGSYKVSGEMVESHTFYHNGEPLRPGSWTDDSSTMLCLLQSLVEKEGKLDWVDVAKKLVMWYQNGYMSVTNNCFDIGISTSTALTMYHGWIQGNHTFPAFPNANPTANLSGNGSLMRLAPVPIIYYLRDPLVLFERAAVSSMITHSSSMCIDACVLMSAYMVGFFKAEAYESTEEKKTRVLNGAFALDGVPIPLRTPEITSIHREAKYKNLDVSEVRTSGFVVHTLEAALWALWKASTYEEGIMLLLPLGEDVDTVCAVYGELAGALFGLEGIPNRWLNALQRKAEILDPSFRNLVTLAMR